MRIAHAMTIYTAAELKPQLLAALQAADALELDLSEVGEMDTAGLQLLVLLQREATRLNRPMRITAASAAVAEILDTVTFETGKTTESKRGGQ